jgi:aminoglycoside phosphotransferase (APT) family kinase protein
LAVILIIHSAMESVTSKEAPSGSAAPILSPAAKYNRNTLRALRKALKDDPETDIASILPRYYSDKLSSFKSVGMSFLLMCRLRTGLTAHEEEPQTSVPAPDDDVRSMLSTNLDCAAVAEPSTDLRALLSRHEDMATSLIFLLAEGEVIYKSAWAASRTVLRISESIVVKITRSGSLVDESRTLAYLQNHLPDFPAPKLHGLIDFGGFYLLFTTFEGPHDLEKIWPQLDPNQKRDMSTQLADLITRLRSLPHPEHAPFGKVEGGRCEDARRGMRTSDEAVTNTEQFEDFVFSGATRATSTYVQFLRDFTPTPPAECVFTHGDIKPGNIIVEQSESLDWKIVAIVDWESSGFYPSYWESIKMTNNLSSMDDDDWYLYLPEPFSPHQHPVAWLLDRVLDRSLEHR